jgi:AcrR family transcriptional regulator
VTERPASLRDDHTRATRRALLDAARARFGAAGFAATSVEQVAADARVTKGAVYHHFGNKTELFREVFLELEAELSALGLPPGAPPPADVVEAMVLGTAAFLDAVMDPAVQRISLLDGPAVLGPNAYENPHVQAGTDQLAAAIALGVRDGTLAPVDPMALARLVMGAATQAGVLIARSPDPPAARATVGGTLRVLVEGLRRR